MGRISIALTVYIFAFIVFAAIAAAPYAYCEQSVHKYTGKTLADALRYLQSQGLKIIFSEKLVHAEMKVAKEPEAKELRKILDELLKPHALNVQPGPENTLLIVRNPDHSSKPPQTGSDNDDSNSEQPLRISLEELVVAPSFSLLESEPESRQFLSRDEINRTPHFSNDFYRALARLPGMAAEDFSAQLNIRGGEFNETLVLLDGMEITDAFHLGQLHNLFSSIDSDAISGIDFFTGGFPIEYRNRMSGVIDIKTSVPSDGIYTKAGVSLLNMNFINGGNFNENRGHWLFSARRGYLDIVLPLVDPESEFNPTYYDFLGKLEHRIGDRHSLGAHFLGVRDDVEYDEDSELIDYSTSNLYTWLDLKSAWNSSLYSHTILFFTDRGSTRIGGVDTDYYARVNDQRSANRIGFKQLWDMEAGASQFIKWGIEAAYAKADYDYQGLSIFNDPLLEESGVPSRIEKNVQVSPSGSDLGIYFADRLKLSNRLTAELGIRWDHQSYTRDSNISPRINVSYQLPHSVVRAAWGQFHQAQRIDELQVEDGVNEFFESQNADHLLVSFEHRWPTNLGFRVEAYQKHFRSLRPRYENLYHFFELFPEAEPDRIRIDPDEADAKGIEFVFKKDDRRFSWWTSYVLSWAEDEIDGIRFPRNWDQRHSVSFSVNYSPNPRWNFNAAGVYRSGWPITELTATSSISPDGSIQIHPQLGPRNGDRLPGYQRLDLRISRTVPLSHGQFTFYAEVTNLYNYKNVSRYEDFHFFPQPNGSVIVVPQEEYWLPWLPSFGLAWEF